jgi:hypothetical protein
MIKKRFGNVHFHERALEMKRGEQATLAYRCGALRHASEDFRYLLNREYPRRAALELVGNRYTLAADERHLLHRAVFAEEEAAARNAKKAPASELRDKRLGIDGYNVLITIEAGLCGRPIVLSDDGFFRDISGLSGRFKATARTEAALNLMCDLLKTMGPREVIVLFDSPISRSGELAQDLGRRLSEEGIRGEAMAVPVPERTLIGFDGIVATSDTAILDRCQRSIDLPAAVFENRGKIENLVDLRRA